MNVDELNRQIDANPDVWNRHTVRLYGPHSKVSDIWVRYNAWENFTDRHSFNAEHESVWYPVTAQIPAVRTIAFDLMRYLEGVRLGGILITRIPPGESVLPHRDTGWHARYYDKFAVQLRSAPGQAFCFEDAQLSAVPGEVYTFDNAQTHWVTNPTAEERMTLILCIRRD